MEPPATAHELSVLEAWLYRQVIFSYRRTRGPVPTLVLAELIGKSDRTARYVLVRLEQRGVLRRAGQRGGWLPVNTRLM
jgi:Mn-dependent DtxR family transcriptional regulator